MPALRLFPVLFALAGLTAGCGRGPSVHVAAQNDAREPVLSAELDAAGDTLRLGRLGPGARTVQRWRLRPAHAGDGDYGVRLALAGGDTLAGRIGHFTGGRPDARSLVVVLSDTALALRVYEGGVLLGARERTRTLPR
ncbi:MAG: hypothetical protein ACK41D_05815 [Rubricoccaceae bacterium]